MIVVSKYKAVLENGRTQVWESIESNTLSNDTKPSADFSPLGSWISEFLSFAKVQCKEYLDGYGFNTEEISNYLHPYNLFNHYLKTRYGDSESFQKLMAENKLKIPEYTYMLEGSEYKEQYYCSDIKELCTALMHNVFMENKFFKICENCGKLFVPLNRSDEKYCLRPDNEYPNKNCRDAAHYKKVLNNRHSDLAKSMIATLKQMNRNSGINNAELSKAIIEKREKVRSGEITKDQYEYWLDSLFKHKRHKL